MRFDYNAKHKDGNSATKKKKKNKKHKNQLSTSIWHVTMTFPKPAACSIIDTFHSFIKCSPMESI